MKPITIHIKRQATRTAVTYCSGLSLSFGLAWDNPDKATCKACLKKLAKDNSKSK